MVELPKNFIAAAMDKEIGNFIPKKKKIIMVLSTNVSKDIHSIIIQFKNPLSSKNLNVAAKLFFSCS